MNAPASWALCLVFAAAAAHANDRVHRCGASYSHEPCTGGSTVMVDDARSASQLAQARRVAQLDARLADVLVRQRLQAEQAAARQGPGLIGAATRAPRGDGRAGQRADGADNPRARPATVTLYRAGGSR